MYLVMQRAIFKRTSCVEELRVWLMKNMLKLNDAKTEFFIAASSHNIIRLSDINFQIGSEVIKPSPTIKNLGRPITIDSAMTMSDHVTSLCKSVNFLLWNLARIRRFIDQNAATSNAMRALIMSKLDYGNALLSSCKNKDVAHLQRLQNRAARIVFQVPRRHSSSPLLASLHWLPIDKRIKFKILLHIYKALNDLSVTSLPYWMHYHPFTISWRPPLICWHYSSRCPKEHQKNWWQIFQCLCTFPLESTTHFHQIFFHRL